MSFMHRVKDVFATLDSVWGHLSKWMLKEESITCWFLPLMPDSCHSGFALGTACQKKRGFVWLLQLICCLLRCSWIKFTRLFLYLKCGHILVTFYTARILGFPMPGKVANSKNCRFSWPRKSSVDFLYKEKQKQENKVSGFPSWKSIEDFHKVSLGFPCWETQEYWQC